MDDNKKPDLLAITPREMFGMIGDFADGLLSYMEEENRVDRENMVKLSEELMEVFRNHDTEGRIAIIVMLQAAVACYEVAVEQNKYSNRTKSVN